MIESTALANAVSAHAATLSGLLALILTALMGAQPRRWSFAYLCVVITGLPTVWCFVGVQSHAVCHATCVVRDE